MKETGEYVEFFPTKFSNFGYNETMAQEHFPLTKEEAISRGFKWWDKIQKTVGKETLNILQIPDSINDVNDSILNEILACTTCGRDYKVVPNELIFLKKHLIPIPRQCMYCRMTGRFKFENPFKLWHRSCVCNSAKHGHDGKCQVEFETPYSSDRPEVVYCDRCYQQEVY